MKNIFTKKTAAALAISFGTLAGLLFVSATFASWVEPGATSTAQSGWNTPQLVDVGDSLQTKTGALELRDTNSSVSLFVSSGASFGSVGVGGLPNAINGINASAGDVRADRLCLGTLPDQVCLSSWGGNPSGNAGDRILKWGSDNRFVYSKLYDTLYYGAPSLMVGTSTALVPVKASGNVTLKSNSEGGGNLYLRGLNSASRGTAPAISVDANPVLSMDTAGNVIVVKLACVPSVTVTGVCSDTACDTTDHLRRTCPVITTAANCSATSGTQVTTESCSRTCTVGTIAAPETCSTAFAPATCSAAGQQHSRVCTEHLYDTTACHVADSSVTRYEACPYVPVCTIGATAAPDTCPTAFAPAVCPASGQRSRVCTEHLYDTTACHVADTSVTRHESCTSCPTEAAACGSWGSCIMNAQCSAGTRTRTCTVPAGCSNFDLTKACTIGDVATAHGSDPSAVVVRYGACTNGYQDIMQWDAINDVSLCVYTRGRACTVLVAPTLTKSGACQSGSYKGTVSWGAVTGATGYTLQSSTNVGASWSNVAFSGTSYTGTVANGQTIMYRAKSRSADGETGYGTSVSITGINCAAGTQTKPCPPVITSLSRTCGSTSNITAYWIWTCPGYTNPGLDNFSVLVNGGGEVLNGMAASYGRSFSAGSSGSFQVRIKKLNGGAANESELSNSCSTSVAACFRGGGMPYDASVSCN